MAGNMEHERPLKRYDDVRKLPLEDTIWLIERSYYKTVKNEVEQTSRVLIVTDRNNCILGTGHASVIEASFVDQCRDLLHDCAIHPMVGLPRRPLKVTFKDPISAEKAAGLDLSDLGIKYMQDRMKKSIEPELVRMKECYVCHLRGSRSLFVKCASCKAVFYCSKTCQQKDWLQTGPIETHSHKYWCGRMKIYMAETEALRQFPFTFAEETTSEDFDAIKYQQFLVSHGVYQHGAWRRECLLPDNQHKQCYCHLSCGELHDDDDLVVLPVESCILDDKPSSPPDGVRCWESYYKWRGFRLDSPIAILLHWPLTIFHIVKHFIPNDYPNWCSGQEPSSLLVDIVGVETEVEISPIFAELGHLLPELKVDIQMYGNTISKKVVGEVYVANNVKIEVIRGLYHRKSSTSRRPHLVIGFNAGLGAYHQWSQTLVKLRALKTPAYFTDYCQYSCAWARNHVVGLELGTTSDPVINHFRKPVRKVAAETDMPWYSNGFIYHLIYPT